MSDQETHIAMDEQEEAPSDSMPATPSGTKRALSQVTSREERQRLRDKNRTNSKRFRDRKKNYMDGLFEEKYRLGKENNELREANEKLRMLLEEAKAENELHKQNLALAGQYSQPLLPMATSLVPMESALAAASLRTNPVDEYSTARQTQQASFLELLQELKAQQRQHVLSDLALQEAQAQKRRRVMSDLTLREFEESLKTKFSHQQSMPGRVLSSSLI